VESGFLSLPQLVDRLSGAPARIFNLPGGSLAPGGPADVVLIDPAARWVVDPETFFSKSRNTPFAGRQLVGRAEVTIVRGQVVFQRKGAD
jgi:dihydroorotase